MGTRALKSLSRVSFVDDIVKGLGLDSYKYSRIFFQDPRMLTGIINQKIYFIVYLHVYMHL